MSLNKPYCPIRVRKSILSIKNKTKEPFMDHGLSNQLKKQLKTKVTQQTNNLPYYNTQLMITSKRLNMPHLLVSSMKNNFISSRSSPRGKTVTENKGKTAQMDNGRYFNQEKPSFRAKRLNVAISPMKQNYSSVLAPKSDEFGKIKSQQNLEQSKENDHYEIGYGLTKLAETSSSELKSFRRIKEDRCLLAGVKRLPFSLDRRSSRKKHTERTNVTSSAEELFDLDISIIVDDENEPGTPFLKRGSDIESMVLIA